MDKLSTLAAANQQRAQEVIRDSGIEVVAGVVTEGVLALLHLADNNRAFAAGIGTI